MFFTWAGDFPKELPNRGGSCSKYPEKVYSQTALAVEMVRSSLRIAPIILAFLRFVNVAVGGAVAFPKSGFSKRELREMAKVRE